MDNGVVVRPAKVQDIDAMVELISLLFSIEEDFLVDAAKQRRALEMFLQYPTGRYLIVAEKDWKVIGMCSAQMLISTAEGGWKVLIEDVVVNKSFRGRGIGKSMLGMLTKWAMQQGAKRMDLLADHNNVNGLQFYDCQHWKKTNLIALQKRLDKTV